MRRGRRADQSVFYQLCCCSCRKNRRPSLGSGRPRRAPQMQKTPPSQSGGTPWNGWQCLALLFSLLHRRPEKSPKLSRPGRRDLLHPAVSGQRLSLSGKRKYFSFSSFHSTAGTFCPYRALSLQQPRRNSPASGTALSFQLSSHTKAIRCGHCPQKQRKINYFPAGQLHPE